MSEYKLYRKKNTQELRPYVAGEVLPDNVSISEADRLTGSPKVGDMIARGAKPGDYWLVAERFFLDNYVEA